MWLIVIMSPCSETIPYLNLNTYYNHLATKILQTYTYQDKQSNTSGQALGEIHKLHSHSLVWYPCYKRLTLIAPQSHVQGYHTCSRVKLKLGSHFIYQLYITYILNMK